MSNRIKQTLFEASLDYHRNPPAGKLGIHATKPLATQFDLSLAYSPGVAAVSEAIADDPTSAAEYTARANLVGVVSNGSAVLGLGNIGPLAAKPVMEGKAVLFKEFANIDVFDIEIDADTTEKMVEVVSALEPTFGGINLEDIKAPECFEVERQLRERLNIPVFHDDQHGTAIIVAAATLNAMRVVDKSLNHLRLVVAGAGAAALACVGQLVELGVDKKNLTLVDIDGVVYAGREQGMDPYKSVYARATEARTLEDAIEGADMFLGLSAGNILTAEMLSRMAPKPIVFALANPTPEIDPMLARETRPDIVLATGRSDHPNQVNNVLCFPYLFRGALDVGAREINADMKVACIEALAELARIEESEVAANAYGGDYVNFGGDHLIPRPFDPRLMIRIAPAVARAAMESGVATRPIDNLSDYEQELTNQVFKSGHLMKTIFEQARRGSRKRVVFAEGEGRRVLQATQQLVDLELARPILVGRPSVIESRIKKLGLRIRPGEDFEVTNPDQDERYFEYWTAYHELLGRTGVTPAYAKSEVRSDNTIIAAMMVHMGDADAVVCGTNGRFRRHLKRVRSILGMREGATDYATMVALILPTGTFFLADTHITHQPQAEQMAEIAQFAANRIRQFGLEPKAAILSHSNFGSHECEEIERLHEALALIRRRDPDLQIDGEMHADAALSERIRNYAMPQSSLTGIANLLIFPNMDAANISYNLLKMLGGGVMVGPILLGSSKPAHILTNAATVRGVLNSAALAARDAQLWGQTGEP